MNDTIKPNLAKKFQEKQIAVACEVDPGIDVKQKVSDFKSRLYATLKEKNILDKTKSTEYLTKTLYNFDQIVALVQEIAGSVAKEICAESQEKLSSLKKEIATNPENFSIDPKSVDAVDKAEELISKTKENLEGDIDIENSVVMDNLFTVLELIMTRQIQEGEGKLSLEEFVYLKDKFNDKTEEGKNLRKMLRVMPEKMAEIMKDAASGASLEKHYGYITETLAPASKKDEGDSRKGDEIMAKAFGMSLMLENLTEDEKMSYARYLIKQIGQKEQDPKYSGLVSELKSLQDKNKNLNDIDQNISALGVDIANLSQELNETYGGNIMSLYTEIQKMKDEMDSAPVDSKMRDPENVPQAIAEKEQQLHKLIKKHYEKKTVGELEDRVDILTKDKKALEEKLKAITTGGLLSDSVSKNKKQELETLESNLASNEEEISKTATELNDLAVKYTKSSKEYIQDKRHEKLKKLNDQKNSLISQISIKKKEIDALESSIIPQTRDKLEAIDTALNKATEELEEAKKDPGQTAVDLFNEKTSLLKNKVIAEGNAIQNKKSLGEQTSEFEQKSAELREKNPAFQKVESDLRVLDTMLRTTLSPAQGKKLLAEAKKQNVNLDLPLLSPVGSKKAFSVASNIEGNQYNEIHKQAEDFIDASVKQLEAGDQTNPLLKMNILSTGLYVLGAFSVFSTVLINIGCNWKHPENLIKNKPLWAAVGVGLVGTEMATGGLGSGVFSHLRNRPDKHEKEYEQEKAKVDRFASLYKNNPEVGEYLLHNFSSILDNVSLRNPEFKCRENLTIAQGDLDKNIVGADGLSQANAERVASDMFNTLVIDLGYRDDETFKDFIKDFKQEQGLA